MMQDPHADDPWLNLREKDRAGGARAERATVLISEIPNVEPLDAQLGAFPKKTVPDALHGAFWGQPQPSISELEIAGGDPTKVAPMQTYAVLDAAKVINLPELLENSGLEHRCLFKGDAYDDLKQVAPWVVKLDQGSDFTRNLFTRGDAPWYLWDADPGIYVRSRGSLEQMWRHFRKFTRIRDERGKWFYFRFWETRWIDRFIAAMPADQSRRLLAPVSAVYAIAAGAPSRVYCIQLNRNNFETTGAH
ncbi:protein of unknown function [Paracoccus alcaliphilus]|uniref:DUF4123 domain-containing protein n=1 Tax=Paracoccus alcaliphilus TaxID=34002 RepID=A0A1H8PLD7_9RHOB|nr:DUF4123 domain-containing protein [Paracoccus alcaliphilus]WCR16953.1 DUF4123 domain-containing protein [Paracoccus alcaliphilus]SEO42528.1 protein of unknown function [Paracoccus alcaliphilus]